MWASQAVAIRTLGAETTRSHTGTILLCIAKKDREKPDQTWVRIYLCYLKLLKADFEN